VRCCCCCCCCCSRWLLMLVLTSLCLLAHASSSSKTMSNKCTAACCCHHQQHPDVWQNRTTLMPLVDYFLFHERRCHSFHSLTMSTIVKLLHQHAFWWVEILGKDGNSVASISIVMAEINFLHVKIFRRARCVVFDALFLLNAHVRMKHQHSAGILAICSFNGWHS
jgi:hypothetical protein